MRAKKPDGEKGLWSNHIKYGPNELFDNIGKLLSAMLVHGTKPYDLLTSTINSIPKDKLADMSDSNNYRGAVLISAISKVYDLRYNKLFELLIKRDFPPIVIRALLDMRLEQVGLIIIQSILVYKMEFVRVASSAHYYIQFMLTS